VIDARGNVTNVENRETQHTQLPVDLDGDVGRRGSRESRESHDEGGSKKKSTKNLDAVRTWNRSPFFLRIFSVLGTVLRRTRAVVKVSTFTRT